MRMCVQMARVCWVFWGGESKERRVRGKCATYFSFPFGSWFIHMAFYNYSHDQQRHNDQLTNAAAITARQVIENERLRKRRFPIYPGLERFDIVDKLGEYVTNMIHMNMLLKQRLMHY